MKQIEQTIDSREVAGMMGKEHKTLLKDIRRYNTHFTEGKIAPSEFWTESKYEDSTGRTLPCYNITKKGCEFIAHKLTGAKGTVFTARYINRFHEMEDAIRAGIPMTKSYQPAKSPRLFRLWTKKEYGKIGLTTCSQPLKKPLVSQDRICSTNPTKA